MFIKVGEFNTQERERTMTVEILGEKELIWVAKEVADTYKALETPEEQEKLVKKLITDKKIDIEYENDLLEESVLKFKSSCLSHRTELKKIYHDECLLIEKMWDELGDHSTEMKKNIDGSSKEINTLTKSVEGLRKQLDNLNVYGADRLCDLATRIANMDENTKSIMRQVLDANKQNKK